MGLNPNMSLGLAGATKTPEGKYIPKMFADQDQGFKQTAWGTGAGGGDWTKAYMSKQMTLSPKLITGFTGNDSIDTLGQTAAEIKTKSQQEYISNAASQIANDYSLDNLGTFFSGVGNEIGSWFSGKPTSSTPAVQKANYAANLATRNYLLYKLADWKYNQGLTTTKPASVPIPTSPTAKAAIAKQQGILDLAAQAVINDTTKEAAAKLATATAQAAVTTAQTNSIQAGKVAQQAQDAITQEQTSGRRRLATAQTAVNNAHSADTIYNTNLSTQLHNKYINQYANAIDYARASNTTIDLSQLINPTALYNQYKRSGTSITPPTTDLTGSGISFVNGAPIITSSLQRSAANSLKPTLATSGQSNNQKPGIKPVIKPVPVAAPKGPIAAPPTIAALNNLVMKPLLPARNKQNQPIIPLATSGLSHNPKPTVAPASIPIPVK